MTEKSDSSKKIEKKYDDKEDLKINKVAHNNIFDTLTKVVYLLLVIGVLLLISVYIFFSNKEKTISFVKDIFEVKENNNIVSIVNDGNIDISFNDSLFNEMGKYSVIKVSCLKYIEKKDISYNVRYTIDENELPQDSIMVRFSYSTNEKDWTMINNVISIDNSTINPLMGNYYDISNVVGKLKIATNKDISENMDKICWKSETIFSRSKDINSKKYKAKFNITLN